MAKQTFSVGQVLTAAQLTSLQQTAMDGGAASAKTASYTLVAADAGGAISMTSTSATTITVNTGLFAAGDTVYIQNLGSGVATITAGTATVNTSATLALAQYEGGTLDFISSSSAVFFKAAGAAPAAGGGMTELSTTTFSGTTTSVTSINQSHKHLLIQINGMTNSGNLEIRPNAATTGGYLSAVSYASASNSLDSHLSPGFTHNASTTNSEYSLIMWIYSYSDSARFKPISASRYFNSTFPDPISSIYGGVWKDNTVVSSIDFVTGTSTSTGTIRIWGVS